MFHESPGSPFAMLPGGWSMYCSMFVHWQDMVETWAALYHLGLRGISADQVVVPGLVVVKKAWYIWYLGAINYIQAPEALLCGQIAEVINARPSGDHFLYMGVS